MENGKYYITPGGDPFSNMALDEWLFEKLRSGKSDCLAYLRLYSWGSEAITIGYNQIPEKAVNLKKLKKGIPIIRRITGGRAIYHDLSELTMTLMLNIAVLPRESQSLKETNRLVSEAIVDVFDMVGLKSDWTRQSGQQFMNSQKDTRKACFDSAARFEIVSDNRKLAAGAQRRIGDYMIHQGSFKVNGITDCPAIGQKGSAFGGNSGYGNKKKHMRYVISDFSNIFPSVFSRKLRLRFKTDCLTENEIKEFEKFIEFFMEKALDKR